MHTPPRWCTLSSATALDRQASTPNFCHRPKIPWQGYERRVGLEALKVETSPNPSGSDIGNAGQFLPVQTSNVADQCQHTGCRGAGELRSLQRWRVTEDRFPAPLIAMSG